MADPNVDCLKLCFRGVRSSAPFKRCGFVDPLSLSLKYKNESPDMHVFHNDPEAKNLDFVHFSDPFTYDDITRILPNMVLNGIMVFNTINHSSGQFINDYREYVQILHMSSTLVLQVIKLFSLKFHVYALNWNESRLLPHFFNHYKEADKIFVIDNSSDDESKEITAKYKRDWMNFDTDNTLNDTFNGFIKLHIWKQSRGLCDFVIVQDLDEFLFFPNYPNKLKLGLAKLKEMNVSILNTQGYNMGCTDEYFNNIIPGQYLSSTVFNGFANELYSKQVCFNPNLITEINYTGGAHTARPEGQVIYQPEGFKAFILHFKNIGLDYLKTRMLLMRDRVSAQNNKIGYAYHLVVPIEQLIDDITLGYEKSIETEMCNLMYPNYRIVSFNGRRCVMDTTLEEKFVNNCLINDHIKSFNDHVFVDFTSDDGYFSVIAKLSGYTKIYTLLTNKSRLANTIFLNNFNNFEIINDDRVLSRETNIFLRIDNPDKNFELTSNVSAVMITLEKMYKLNAILNKFKDFSKVLVLDGSTEYLFSNYDKLREKIVGKESVTLLFER